MSQLYILQSKEFEKSTFSNWKLAQNDKYFCDVTLACEDKQIPAHKIILASISKVFANLLVWNPHQHPLIYLRGVKHEDLLNLINFIYQGEVNIKEQQIKQFLQVAKDFKIDGLSDYYVEDPPSSVLSVDSYEGACSSIAGSISTDTSENVGVMGGNGVTDIPTDYEKPHEDISLPKLMDEFIHNLVDDEPKDPIEIDHSNSNQIMIEQFNGTPSKKRKVPPKMDPEVIQIFDQPDDNPKLESNPATIYTMENPTLQFSCGQCNYTTSNILTLGKHVETDHKVTKHSVIQGNDQAKGKSDKVRQVTHSCDKCDYTTIHISILRKHVESEHSNTRLASALERGQVIHSCDKCNYSSENRMKLIMHVKLVHGVQT